MLIDLSPEGLGDVVSLMYLSHHLEFHTDDPNKIAILNLCNQPVATKDQAVKINQVRGEEHADVGRQPRLKYICDFLGIDHDPRRPTLTIPESAWAERQLKLMGKSQYPVVLFFPQSHHSCREWHSANWCWLAWELILRGVAVGICLLEPNEDFYTCPHVFAGQPITDILALMAGADLVVGCDSAPAHIAGLLQVPTVAVMGPTKANIFDHCSDCVTCVSSDRLPCVGCNFHPKMGFGVACEIGCRSLLMLDARQVYDAIRKQLAA